MTHLLVQPRAGLLRALVCAGLVVGWFAAAVSGQPPSGPAPAGDQGALAAGAPPVADPVTIDLTTRRTALQADGSLDPELKSRVVDLYTRAIEERQKALDAAAENDALAQRIEDAPARIRALESAREAAPPESARLGTLTLEELTALARQKEQQLVEARTALTAEEKALAALTTQGPTLSGTVAQLSADLQSLQRDDHRSAPSTESPAATSAREAYRNAHEARVRAEFALAEQTIANYELLVRLATLQRDANALLVPRLDAEREALSKAIEEQRQEHARAGPTDALPAEIATADYPAAVSALAADNAKLREELEFVTRKSSEVAEQLRASQRKTGELEADLASILERVNTVGPTEAVGRLWRRQLHSLNVSGTDRLRARARAEEIVRATDQRIDLSEQRRELADVEARTKAVLDAVPEAERKAFDAATLEAKTETLVKAKRATVEALQEAYGRYLTQLTSYDAAERQLAAGTNAMLAFIRKELVWIRSLPPMAATDFVETPRLLAEMVDPEAWRRVVTDAGNAAASNSLRAITLGLGLLLLIVLRPRLRRRLSDIVKLTGRMRTDAFRYTVQALLITLLIASALPLILTYAGWLAGAADDAGPFSVKISATLPRVWELLIIFSAARWVLHPDGLALNHFGWPNGLCVSLRRQMHWLALVALSCIAVAGYARQDASPTASLALGRPALLVFCAALVVFLWRLLRTDGPVVALMRARDPTRFAVRTWPVWCVLMVAVPVVLGIAAAVGYFYTAREALILLINTAWLVLGVHILRGVALRWFTVSERKLRLEQALKLREEARSERERQSRGEEGVVEALEIEVPKVDFRELGDQGRTVVHAAVVVGVLLSVWTLWADLLPALNIADSDIAEALARLDAAAASLA